MDTVSCTAGRVQPLAMSVSVRVWTNSPSDFNPSQCSPMSISKKPGGKGTHRDAAPNLWAHVGASFALPVDEQTRMSQHAIDGRGADLREFRLDNRIRVEMCVPLHCLNQLRYQRLQALAANPVGRPPTRPSAPDAPPYRTTGCAPAFSLPHRALSATADGLLAVILGRCQELVENPDPVTEPRAAMPQLQCCDPFLACLRGDCLVSSRRSCRTIRLVENYVRQHVSTSCKSDKSMRAHTGLARSIFRLRSRYGQILRAVRLRVAFGVLHSASTAKRFVKALTCLRPTLSLHDAARLPAFAPLQWMLRTMLVNPAH